MAYSDFRDKMRSKRTEAELKYQENSDEAWDQIKGFFTDANHLIVMGIALLLIVAGVFIVKFVGAIRAPSLPNNNSEVITLADNMSAIDESGDEIPIEEIDDSNTVQPTVSGARKEDVYTFLLIGTDASSSNTDTLMVVSYDVGNQKLNLMSIPRDTMVNVSWDIKKINSVYGMSGINGLKRHIGKLIGFTPDFYVKIDLNAFVKVVDLLGGVEVDVPVSMHYHDPAQGLSIDLEPGVQTLGGEQAMGLVRFRKSDRGADGRITGYDDTGRVQTQQLFLKAMFTQCLSVRNWTKITDYVEIFQRDVESDLTLGEMLWFARKAMDLGEDGFMTCTIPGNYYASAWSRSTQQYQSYVTLYARQVIQLVNESFNPYLTNVTMSNLDIMSINSDGSVSSSTGYVADSRAAMPPVTEPAEPAISDEPTEPAEPEEPAEMDGTDDTPIAPIDSLIPPEPETPPDNTEAPAAEPGPTTTDTTPSESGEE